MAGSREKPRWDAERRELWWRGKCVKRLRDDAANQGRVLEVFQEQGWVERIEDPLPRDENVDTKARLRETLKGLNRTGVWSSPRKMESRLRVVRVVRALELLRR
jgi:hypothetical protein